MSHETGFVYDYLGADLPAGYLDADGALHPIADYPALFAILGTTWGGDGVTTFGVPDMRGRNTIGQGTGPTLTARDRGTIGGAENVQLGTDNLSPHKHQPSGDAILRYVGSGGTHTVPLTSGSDIKLQVDFPNTGGNVPHDNMPPYAVVRKLIKT